MGGKWRFGLALLAMAGGTAAQAAGGCWQDNEVSAARVRQMQTMLMVATLRCRAAHVDIVKDYDGFVTARGAAIASANEAIKRHFAQAGGAQADYDRFATSLANGYGDDATDEASCAEAAALAHDATAATDAPALQAVAARLFPSALPGGVCSTPRMAEAERAAPVIALAAPAETAVTLPADVVAALTVMARLQAPAPVAPASAPVVLASAAP